MITITEKGVNFCTCMMCNTSFFFDKEDIRQGKKYPFVECPCCTTAMYLGRHGRYFKHVDKNRRP